MPFTFLHRYPFLRLLLPLAVGIYVGDELFFCGWEIPVCGALIAILSSLVLLFAVYSLKRYTFRWLFGMLLFLFCLVGGACWVNIQLQRTRLLPPGEGTVYRAVIAEKPELKERSILCRILLTERYDSIVKVPELHHHALIYLAKDSLSEQLHSGDVLLIASRISPPSDNGNFDEFDYSRYLARKQVCGTGFVSAGDWTKLAHKEPPSFRQQALAWRERILDIYRELGFQQDVFAVLSALTVGYQEELSEEIRETYSVSGASHVLALSGLHIAFLYGLLLFCMKGLPEHWKGTRLIRALVIIILLWGFAFFTGLSPSVIRSVIMCSLFSLSGAFGRQSFSMNTLAAAAFFMLLLQPGWLFDVGFQLSFCAVAAILLIHPRLYRILPVSNRFTMYTWKLMSVSIAAQIGTAPLVLLYFSRFSTHFLLTNLLVIPLVSFIMYAALVLLLLTPFPWLQSVVSLVVRGLVEGLNASARWVEQLPWSSLDHLWVYPLEVLIFYVVLLFLIHYWISRKGNALVTCLCGLFILCTFHAIMYVKDRPRESLVFYNVRGCPVVHCIAVDGRSWLAYADTMPDEIRLQRVASRYWQHLHLAKPLSVTIDYDDTSFCYQNRILSFSGHRVCLVNDNRWQNKTTSQLLFVDCLYLCKGYDGRLEWLSTLFAFKTVILDASLSDYRCEAFKQECRQLGIQFISLAEKGSVRFLL